MKFKNLLITLLASAFMLIVGCKDSSKPQHHHEWGDPTYLWAGDYSTCTATRVCTLDETHVQSETVAPTYDVIVYPTEILEGLGRYTATFTNTAFVTQTVDVTLPVISDVDTYEEALASVSTKHNYSAHLTNQWANESSPFADFNYYNIDDNAMFDDLSTYFYSGYIKQKDQGIVTFQLNKSSTSTGGLILGNFVATNLERSISDIYSLAVEHLVDKTFTFDSDLGLYKSTSMDAMAILANLAFGDYTSLVSAPEYITAKFEGGYLIYRGIFDINYFDEVEVHTTGDVTLKVFDFEKTHNSVIESYVASPDYTYAAPTEWDDDTLSLFNQEFNGLIPPFLDGISYAWKSGQSVSEGYYVAMVEDYFGGDLTVNYRDLLENAGFHEVSNPALIEYQMIVEDVNLVHTYSVKMRFYAPTDKDPNQMEYGYLFPNGVTSIKFLHKQKTKETITTVALLNEYLSNTAVGDFIPKFDLAADTRVAYLSDSTSSDENYALLLKGNDGAFFRIYADTKAHATTAVEKYISDLRKLGFEGTSSSAFQQYWMSDEYFSQVKITDPSKITTWTPGTSYLQVRIEITESSLEEWREQVVELESISVSGQKTVFTVDEEFKFDGIVTARFSNGYEETVTPTSVSSPDMSTAGEKEVVVTYEYEGVTKTFVYTITVNSKDTLYNISITQVPGATVTLTYPKDTSTAKANTTVTFEVIPEEGYKIDNVIAKSNDTSIEVYGPTLTEEHGFVGYAIVMPTGDVTITAVASEIVSEHTISYVIKDQETGASLPFANVISPTSVLPTKFNDNSTVNFTVNTTSNYTFDHATIGDATFNSNTFSYNALDSDLVVTIYVTNEGGDEPGEFGGSYRLDNGNFNTYILTFNDDGTGTYVRDVHNSDPRTYTATFTYTVKDSAVTITLTGFVETGTDNTSYQNGYRLFLSGDIGATNNTCVISEDNNSLTISLYTISSSPTSNTRTFSK